MRKYKSIPAVDRRRVSQISLYACQFKSIGKLRKLAELLEQMEVEFGVHSCEVELANCFVCSWITEEQLDKLATEGPMHNVVVSVVRGMSEKVKEYNLKRTKKKQNGKKR